MDEKRWRVAVFQEFRARNRKQIFRLLRIPEFHNFDEAMSWLRRLVASPHREDPGSVPGQPKWEVVTPIQALIQVFRFFLVNIISPELHCRLHLSNTPVKRRSGRRLGTFQQSIALTDIRKHCIEKSFRVFLTQTKLLEDKTPVMSDERTPQGDPWLKRSHSPQVRERLGT